MKNIIILPSFERDLKKLPSVDRGKVVKSLGQFNEFIASGNFSQGLGLKKINHDKYEFRVDIRLRIVFKQMGQDIYLVLVGSHDEVKKYLRQYRQK
ncbi:MAG: hypothetical protein HQL26_02800 [Candidatus Omnitrophica bacterium]|nr:hypothetical protein [Candidatus Omnitrophota bacterium]